MKTTQLSETIAKLEGVLELLRAGKCEFLALAEVSNVDECLVGHVITWVQTGAIVSPAQEALETLAAQTGEMLAEYARPIIADK